MGLSFDFGAYLKPPHCRDRDKTPVMERAYQEVNEFLAGGTTPQNIVAFRPSEAAKARVESLVAQQKSGGLSADENSELEHYIQLEHLDVDTDDALDSEDPKVVAQEVSFE